MKDEWFADRFREISHSLGVIEEDVRGMRSVSKDHEARIRKLEEQKRRDRRRKLKDWGVNGGAGAGVGGIVSIIIYLTWKIIQGGA